MVHRRLTEEQWLAEEHFCNDTSCRPQIARAVVVGVAKCQLWCSVKTRTDVGEIWLTLHNLLSTAEVTDFELMVFWIDENVSRLYVSMADTTVLQIG